MYKKFDFDDINLIPRYSIVNSRNDCDTSISIGTHKFKNPIIPANMESVINEKIAKKLSKNGYFYIMHRFDIDIKDFIKNMKSENLITSISIGVNSDSYDLIKELIDENLIPDYITIDIAHGHCKKMKKILKFIKEEVKINSYIIAGNVSSVDATVDLDNWGADAIKIGIGPGCFTPDSLVLTKDGNKMIKDINIGDFVLTHTNTYKKVLQKHKYNNKDIMIKINNLPLCTPNHNFYVINKKDKNIVNDKNINDYAFWVESSRLNKNKHLLIKKENFIEIEKIKEFDYSGEVIDLTVETDKSYNIEGVLVHNSACTTYPTTGFGSRNTQASVVHECSMVTKKHIISDGGIKYPADITKSIVLGASMAMVGGMLSSFLDSPGKIVEIDGTKYKEFYGSASSRQGKKTNRIEGTVKLNKLKNVNIIDYLDYLTECLQSSISYGGGNKLSDLYSVKWF